ncbi:hypothetical protein [Flavobacterium sp. N2820]|jgi:hypothetical protein|uniref:hypothetical protein n=1 Tax=Flavobacterium sp. N2820 TaxID=2986834 RepID=UPI0022251AAD|nr:hypothetical protein [Flavobacterium sp. N2820]
MKYFIFLFLSISMFSQKREITYNLHFNNSEKSSSITIKEEKKMLLLEYKLIDSISSALNKDKKYNRILRKIEKLSFKPENLKRIENYVYQLNIIKEKYFFYKSDRILVPISENEIFYNDFNNLFNTHVDILKNKKKTRIVLDSNRNIETILKFNNDIKIIFMTSPDEKSHPILISFLKNTLNLYREQKQNNFLKKEYIYNY